MSLISPNFAVLGKGPWPKMGIILLLSEHFFPFLARGLFPKLLEKALSYTNYRAVNLSYFDNFPEYICIMS